MAVVVVVDVDVVVVVVLVVDFEKLFVIRQKLDFLKSLMFCLMKFRLNSPILKSVIFYKANY